jgi:FtsP/CotA-like multicopper oxidase with cupredoxin domain
MARKLVALFGAFALLATIVTPGVARVASPAPAAAPDSVPSAPSSPTDESKVPHYFGPYPNWANGSFTLPDVAVEITGDGSGAAASATVGANGAVTGINITDPGRGYSAATVSITGGGTGASADAVITATGVVTAVNVGDGGAGYTAPVVTISGGGATTDATATAYGGVTAIHLVTPGSGYSMPTVDFDLPDAPDGTQARGNVLCAEPNCAPATDGATVTITGVDVVDPGSGYSAPPNVVIRDGTIFDPITHDPGAFTEATATATLTISSVSVDSFGAGYTSVPTVDIADPNGLGASATAVIDAGAVTGIANLVPGSGYVTQGGIKKFQDGLPVLCDPTAGWDNCTDNNLGQHMPIAVPDTETFSKTAGFSDDADYYVIAVVQHREQMSSSLPATGTLLREYVQLETPANASFSKHVALQTDLLDGTSVPTLMPDGSQAIAVDDPHYLGPVIVASKDKPVRIVFYNLLPKGAEGDLFLPTDSTLMGSGTGPTGAMDPMDQGSVMDLVRNPACSEYPKPDTCFKDDRATLHLHGGITPWISDGTPHQWITPADEATAWPQGVSVGNVPDMTSVPGVPDCTAQTDGCQTFYYTNQQSARLMFYHDHAWGITRLNVYAGEAAGYLITDPTEQKLVDGGIIPADQIPLVIQDKTFVPNAAQLAAQDPTWDTSRWGDEGNLWYHHVYMPAQNPGDPSGMSAYGRWMYGPWFWPPATPPHGPIDNPYYDPNCNLDDPATWQYDTDPFCEPALIPGTPNISVGMEQFNDTPVVNGTAYPTTSVEPKSYRLRILNAANDRFWNLQWYVADPTTGTDSEVALKASELAAAQTDPNVFPTPDTAVSPAGPSWIQIGTEGGFLPAPVVVPNQPITWITDPTRFDVGNVDKHALLLAPAERADVIVDFSKYAGKTLILYNDAPAAFPARVASYDYYTGAPDLSPVGAPSILPGYGPNTRTIMQVKVAATTPASAFNLSALNAAFRHHADGSGVFESGQHPIIVGQATYNSAYGTSFAASSWCNAPGSASTRCDGYARISEQGGDLFGFNTLRGPITKTTIPLQPKAIHDEMNSTAFDEFGRMQANLGVEAVPATPAAQNITLYPYVNPQTELIDATNLPKGDVSVSAISTAGDDGTQIWKITHNGVDTHPIHFHLYDVQVLNRVTWDNIIIPPDATELGWKDTVRISPLEDTLVALRPIIPTLPFELPNSIRPLNPMTPLGSPMGFNNIDPNGNPTAAIANALVNFGWEYVYHCHILSHEEMDMMRPVSVALPPNAPDGLTSSYTTSGATRVVLTWNDNSINETSFVVQRTTDGTTWTDVGTSLSPLDQANTHGIRTLTDTSSNATTPYRYRIVALNTVGYGAEFPSLTVKATSATLGVNTPAAPTSLTATLQAGPQISLTFRDNANNESGFIVERAADGGAFTQIATAPARNGTGNVTYVDATAQPGTAYTYRVAATNLAGTSTYSNTSASVAVPVAPAAPSSFTAANGPNGNGGNRTVILTWAPQTINLTGFTIQRATNPNFTGSVNTANVPAATATLTQTGLGRNTSYYFRIRANNGSFVSSAWVNATPFPIVTNP